MAAGLFAAQADGPNGPFEIASAGVAACVGQPAPPPVIALMEERGLNLSEHRAQQFTGDLARGFELVLVMEEQQKRYIEDNWKGLRGRVRRLGDWRNEDIHDPYGQSEEAYAECLSRIETCLGDWQERLLP